MHAGFAMLMAYRLSTPAFFSTPPDVTRPTSVTIMASNDGSFSARLKGDFSRLPILYGAKSFG